MRPTPAPTNPPRWYPTRLWRLLARITDQHRAGLRTLTLLAAYATNALVSLHAAQVVFVTGVALVALAGSRHTVLATRRRLTPHRDTEPWTMRHAARTITLTDQTIPVLFTLGLIAALRAGLFHEPTPWGIVALVTLLVTAAALTAAAGHTLFAYLYVTHLRRSSPT